MNEFSYIGTILNRFSKDIGDIDDVLSSVLLDCIKVIEKFTSFSIFVAFLIYFNEYLI